MKLLTRSGSAFHRQGRASEHAARLVLLRIGLDGARAFGRETFQLNNLQLNEQHVVSIWITNQNAAGKAQLLLCHDRDIGGDKREMISPQLFHHRVQVIGRDRRLPMDNVVRLCSFRDRPAITRSQVLEKLDPGTAATPMVFTR